MPNTDSIARHITRFSRREILELVKKSKTTLRTPELDIKRAPRVLSYARILIVTPRKVGTAPERNRVRRQIKAIFYQNKLFEKTHDLMCYIKKTPLSHEFLISVLSKID